MAKPFPRAKLGDVTVNHDARRVPVREADRKLGPYPYYGASGVVDHVDGYLFDGLHLLIAEDGENLRTRQTPVAFLATGRFWVNNHAHIVNGNEHADTRYLCYALAATDISGYLTGSAMPKLSQRAMNAIEIPLPSMHEQRAIAGVLGVLDDKIEQNRRTSAALERVARAMFRAWFVDFEPVKAKAAGAAGFPSMPQPVFDALPTRLVDSELGPLPEGWEIKPLSEVVVLTMGQSPSSEFYNETGDGLPFHQGVTDYGFRFPIHRVYCTADGRIGEPNDVLLSVRAPVGRINVADRRLMLGRGLAGLRHRNGRQSFLLQQMRHVFAVEDAIGDGTIYKAVTKQFLANMPVLAPPDTVQEAFDGSVLPMDALVISLEQQSRKLGETRDYLLPKLLSGRVRVRVANA
jgi:type I restriction enzyme, S subunit